LKLTAYRRPPVIESVIEFQVDQPVAAAALNRLRDRIAADFSNRVDEQNFNVHIDPDAGTINVTAAQSNIKMLDDKGAHLLTLKPDIINFSKFAPYQGWSDLSGFARKYFPMWVAEVRPKGSVQRIGIRTINRLDIPAKGAEPYDLDKYLNFTYRAPQPPLNPSLTFLVTVESFIGDNDECGVRYTSTTAESALVGHASIILDLDIYTRAPIAVGDEGLWPLVERMRDYKNAVFEACITDEARALFGHA
jgi:uncharacterized protein (TIGR04255 family)